MLYTWAEFCISRSICYIGRLIYCIPRLMDYIPKLIYHIPRNTPIPHAYVHTYLLWKHVLSLLMPCPERFFLLCFLFVVRFILPEIFLIIECPGHKDREGSLFNNKSKQLIKYLRNSLSLPGPFI